MMNKPETSPFTPGQPAPFELFVGRTSQVEALLQHARDAASGRLRVGFLTGDRGIGKTSLARVACFLAERDHALLGLHVVLGSAADAQGMVHRVFDRLANVAREGPLWKRIGGLFGNRVRSVGQFDFPVEFHPEADDLDILTVGFDLGLRVVLRQLEGSGRQGLFIVLDDINGLASSPNFGAWLKDFVDTVAESGEPFPVFLLFVGSEWGRRALTRHDESIARILIPQKVPIWSRAETLEFYNRAFARVGMTVEEPGLGLMSNFVGGLPLLAHEIGDAAFRFTSRSVVSRRDAQRAVVGAANILGHKHFAPEAFEDVLRYHPLLRTIPRDAPTASP